jgi:hypothetical protein
MKYREAERNREMQTRKEKTKKEEGDGLLAEKNITLPDSRLRHLLATLDKCCEALVQESLDSKLLIGLMGGALENIIKHFSTFTKPNGTREKWLKIIEEAEETRGIIWRKFHWKAFFRLLLEE